MARQRISLVPEEIKQKATLESRIRSGEINSDNFHTLSPEEQQEVNKLLFKMASEHVEPNIGASVLEFLLLAFIRITNKKLARLPLSKDEKDIEESLNQLYAMHDITNENVSKKDWLFDYMEYMLVNANKVLDARKNHIERKKEVTGYPKYPEE